MTLSDYVDFICTKMHLTEDPSRAEAWVYVMAWYQTIYASVCW
jgi:hypothetical protein